MEHILIVHGRPDRAGAIAQVLRAEGYEVRVVLDRTQTRVLAGALEPDLILLDLLFPGLDTTRLLGGPQHGRLAAGCPVVLLVPAQAAERVCDLMADGDDDFAIEPVRNCELVARVRGAITRRQRRDAAQHLACGLAVRKVVSAMGHDIANSLTLILGTCHVFEQRLKVGELPSTPAERLEQVARAARRIESITRLAVEDSVRASGLPVANGDDGRA